MSTQEDDDLVGEYADWLKRASTTVRIGDWQEISLPFLDPLNDYTVFYARIHSGQIELSDDGATLENLYELGVSTNGKRGERIKDIATQFGAIVADDGEITLSAPASQRGDAVNEFMQALIRIQSFSETARHRVAGYFADDVAAELRSLNIYFSRGMKVQGTTSYTHTFDFVFQESKNHPTRFCYTPASLGKTTVGQILWSWEDTRKAPYRAGAKLIVIVDDRLKAPSQKAFSAFENVGVGTLRFSELDAKAPAMLGS